MTLAASTIELLACVPCFAGLAANSLERLAAHGRLLTLESGQALCRRGEVQTHLSIVSSGSLEISIHSRSGKRHVLSYLYPGELFGLVPALDGREVIHDADARGRTSLLQLPHHVLLEVARSDAKLLLRFLQLMCGRFRVLYQNFAFRQLLPLHERLVLLLTELVDLEPQVPLSDRGRTTIQMTQSTMSDMLCVSRQSLSAELKHLERSGYIEIGHAGLTVLDPVALGRYAASLV